MPLTNTGFVADTADEIVQDLNAKILAKVDQGLDLSPDQPFGQVIGILSEKFAEIEELEATVYNALNPAAAEGVQLDNISALTGTRRQLATYSKVTATLSLAASTTVSAGAVAAVLNQPSNRWVLLSTVTSTTAGAYTAQFRSEQTGVFTANAGTLTVIATPVIGWTAVTNPADSIPGFNTATDTQLRLTRDEEVTGQGSGDVDAIRAAVLKVPGVISAFVFENTTLAIDANGLPPKSFRVVVWDGASPAAANSDIAQAIWLSKPSGIQSDGNVLGTATDSQGNPQNVFFDRATQIPVFVQFSTTPALTDPTDIANMKAAVKAFADATFVLGSPVIYRAFSASPLETTPVYTPPVTDVPIFYMNTGTFGTGTSNLPASNLQIYTVALNHVIANGL